ncbi:hypothetical protein AMAG_20688 [Allomyces macrogynus ATCC 38327]|uniref:Helicase ATP-binding domain-containing protein n=1 Tax=Allomyces macrogynus (strain ATCC 38327) TaxID=578462 RepID=A0A0L0TEP4_ALLM3|nr:hypothetical protein AMAG_20688 [Allomyces macrogynus ATCC 38327]|eukprot:KNE73044.1 hypothetical protein AMAG_20688 [Allomyces macrogynus ATCC 38327]
MSATRRPRRAAATAAAAAIAGDPLPEPAADPPALPRAARPRAAATPRRTARATPTTAPRPTRASAAAAEPESDTEDEPEDEPKPKRQRRKGPAKPTKAAATAAAAASVPAPAADEEIPVASSSRVTRSATLAERVAHGPSPPKYVEPPSSTDDEDQPEPEPEPVPKGKGKAKAKKTVDDEPIPADWVPHAIDEVVPDHTEAELSSQAAVVDSQAALLSQQHFVASAAPATAQPENEENNDGDNEEQGDDAANWWRFFPDVLSKTPDDVDLGNQLDANADDGALLAAGVHDRTGFGHWFDPIANNGDAAAAPARPMLEDDGEEEEQETPAVKAGLERNENQLFVSSESVSLRFRLPMPPTALDMNSFKCLVPSVLADVTARYVPILRVRRPRITDDGFFEYSWGMMTDDIYYVHPDSMTVTDDELKALTVDKFADLEQADPYYERAKRVQPSPGREDDEKVREDGFVDAVRGIDRVIMDRLVLSFKTDAVWRHDGDWPEEPGANDHQNSYAAGRLFVVWSGANNMWGWTTDHNQYYRIVLRSIQDEVYSPPDPTAPQDRDGWGHRYDQYRYELCIYLQTDRVNAALRDGTDVPGFSSQMSHLMRTIETRNSHKPPKFYVPDTVEGGHAPAPTPPGFQLQLHDYQQRTLGDETSTPEQRGQFMATTLRGCPNWIQLGKDGMWVNLATFKTAADPSVWNDRHLGTAGLECRGALEVSKMGAGKTIMALSLVAANPFRSVRGIVWDDPNDKFKYLVSRATLIVVRSDLVTQWVAEAQKALPAGAKIVQVATIRDHRDLTWNDVLLADVVIISLAFLQNQNYQKRVAKVAKTGGRYCLPRAAYQHSRSDLEWQDSFYRRQRWYKAATPATQREYNDTLDTHIAGLHERTRARFGTDKDAVIFDRVHWHRIVIDEIHELSHVMSARDAWSRTNTRVAETLLFTLKTRFRLGLTGTPPLSHPVCVVSLAEAVGVRNLPTTVADAQAFLNSHVRRNEPDLEVPPVHYQTNWVDLTPAELGLMASYQRQSVRSRLMMCNHHQIHDDVVAATGVTATFVDEP